MALRMGGEKAVIKAINLTIREAGFLKPISDHKEIRREASKCFAVIRHSAAKTGSGLTPASFPKLCSELGEYRSLQSAKKPTIDEFDSMHQQWVGKKLDPRSPKGKVLVELGRQNNTSHKGVGINGYWKTDNNEIKDVRKLIIGRDIKRSTPRRERGGARGRGRGRNRGGRNRNRRRHSTDPSPLCSDPPLSPFLTYPR
jgi:hypothetical protein